MNDKIEEIRDRVEQDVAKGPANEAISRVHKDRAFLLAEVDHQRAEIERLRDVLRRVVVYPSGDRAARIAFVSVGCQVSFPLHPQTTWALELLIEFDQARRNALEGKP